MVAPLTGDAKRRKVATSSVCAFLVLHYHLMRICYGIMEIYSQSLEYIVIIYVGIRCQILFGWYKLRPWNWMALDPTPLRHGNVESSYNCRIYRGFLD